ncbi:MAG TPA: metalloregulator ArsR/SmtB family transcription factor [Thermoanaerobaculia bacterium]|jgi:ArsR family transcriptional regulator
MKPDLVTLFQALGDRTRLRILNLVAAGEVCVCYFVELLGDSQPKVSRHLAYLRRAGLVSTRRDGKWIHYSLARPADPAAASVLEATLAALTSDRQMQRDISALERTCCAVKLPAALQNAPKPVLTNSRSV